MGVALGLAARGLGRCWPNPSVGCVLVRPGDGHGRTLGRGWTQAGGRPHAETEALRRAGSAYGRNALEGATAYVTLEPCDHHGKTPPCTEALIQAGIGRVVVAAPDPDPRVNGAGVARLRAAGITVDEGVLGAAARSLNLGHTLRHTAGRPLVTLKTAASLDGRIAVADGTSRWITGPEARAYGHVLRARHDAIMVGIATVLNDDPKLDCRLPGLAAASPVRVVLDSKLRLPPESQAAQGARQTPTWVICGPEAGAARASALQDLGVDVIRAKVGPRGRIVLGEALAALSGRGVTRLLVEGGAALAASLLRDDLVDRLALFQAPTLIGDDGRAVTGALGVSDANAALRFEPMVERWVGGDRYMLLAAPGR